MNPSTSTHSPCSPFLFLLNSLTVGGSERKTVAVANALHQAGWPVHLAYLNAPATLMSEVAEGLPVICLHRRARLDGKAKERLARYVRQHEIRRVLAVNLYPAVYAWQVARDSATCLRGYDVLINTTLHESWSQALRMAVYAPVLRRARRLVFGCRYQQQLWIKKYRLSTPRCSYIYNGVDVDRYSAVGFESAGAKLRRSQGWANSDFVVGTVGQLLPKKGHGHILEACARLQRRGLPARVLIVGEGPQRPVLEQRCRRLGVEKDVALLGQKRDVRPALAATDVFVLSSVSVETFSNAALEAMAMERPVVLSDLSGAAEMVRDGTSGYLYPVGDVDALVERLARLAEDSALRWRLQRAARTRVEELFSFQRMVSDYQRLVLDSEGGVMVAPAVKAVSG